MLKVRPKAPEPQPSPVVIVTPEIEKMVQDGQRLLVYIARNGHTDIDAELSGRVVEAKYRLDNDSWSAEIETEFLASYDKLAKLVHPVTVDSINAVIPKRVGATKDKTKAEKAVIWYRRYTMVALVLLITMQAYWLFGNDLRVNLQQIFEDREQTRLALQRANPDDDDWEPLTEQLRVDNQRFDANYNLLLNWNQVWTFGNTFELKLPEYFRKKYELEKLRLLEDEASNRAALEDLELNKSLHEVRIVVFENMLSADFVLSAFQSYILPLLYGLLGAFIYVLRELLNEVKELTYNFDSEIRYRLRLTLGSLGGMVIGFFLKDDSGGGLASLSPMAVAFLMGYNVEVLFSIMDKMIDNIKSAINKPQDKPPQAAETAASAKE